MSRCALLPVLGLEVCDTARAGAGELRCVLDGPSTCLMKAPLQCKYVPIVLSKIIAISH